MEADDLDLYCLRHTYCTDLQKAGVPINIAKDLMGHSDITVTANIYTHSNDESIEAARNLINAREAAKTPVSVENSTETGEIVSRETL